MVFQNAAEEVLTHLVKEGVERSIEEGEYYFLQGDPADYAYILLAGRIKLLQTSKTGQQINLRTINAWQMFGALGAVRLQATYPASAQALEDCNALAINSKILKELIDVHPNLSIGLMKLMTDYIQEMQERYRELATEKVERRIARALLRLTAQMGVKKELNTIELSFTRKELSEMAGTTLYTVSRVLSEWERLGLVETGRERVVILRPHELVVIAEELGE
jgi:CRP-like cAMP-binding protein